MGSLARLIASAAIAAGSAIADLMTAEGTGIVEDLSSRTGLGYGVTNGPVTLSSGIVFTAAGSQGAGAILGTGTYYLGSHGTWGDNGELYMGVNNASGAWIRLALPALSSEVTAFVNYAPGLAAAPTIAALDSSLNVLESYNLAVFAPISTPPGSAQQGAYRGISRAAGDIKYFEIRNAYMVAAGVRFLAAPIPAPGPEEAAAVPEPVCALLFGFSVAASLTRRRSTAGSSSRSA